MKKPLTQVIYELCGFQDSTEFSKFWATENLKKWGKRGRYHPPPQKELARRQALFARAANGEAISREELAGV